MATCAQCVTILRRYVTFGVQRRAFGRRITDAQDATITGENQTNDIQPLSDSLFMKLDRSERIFHHLF
jgi:hypothetical protein